jgi:hypothetical protein
MKLTDFPRHVQERIIKENPDVFRPVETKKPKSTPAPPLASGSQEHKGSTGGMEGVITFTAHLRRVLDDDNLAGSIKPLRDAIARSLGIDDGDKSVRWEYGQIETRGTEGVLVKLELTCLGNV